MRAQYVNLAQKTCGEKCSNQVFSMVAFNVNVIVAIEAEDHFNDDIGIIVITHFTVVLYRSIIECMNERLRKRLKLARSQKEVSGVDVGCFNHLGSPVRT